ncbi:unnamed protein product, partial [Tilletia caries]
MGSFCPVKRTVSDRLDGQRPRSEFCQTTQPPPPVRRYLTNLPTRGQNESARVLPSAGRPLDSWFPPPSPSLPQTGARLVTPSLKTSPFNFHPSLVTHQVSLSSQCFSKAIQHQGIFSRSQ